MPRLLNPKHMESPLSLESIAYDFYETYQYRPNGGRYYLWLQTYNGRGVLELQGEHIILEKGHGALIAPFVPHHYYPLTPSWKTNFITFSGYLSNIIKEILGNEEVLLANDQQSVSFTGHIQKTIDNCGQKIVNETTDLDKLSTQIYEFLLLLKKYGNLNKAVLSPQYTSYIFPVLKLIRTRYREDLSTKELAAAVYISPQYLNKLFHFYFQMSTYQYLKKHRINQAKKMLLSQSTLSINQVCGNVGFSDTSRFIHSFKKETGYTPSEYRRAIKNSFV